MKVNYRLYMDVIKLPGTVYGRNQREIDIVIQTVLIFSKGMCVKLCRGKKGDFEGAKLPDVSKFEHHLDTYKYLGILGGKFMNGKMKGVVNKEY